MGGLGGRHAIEEIRIEQRFERLASAMEAGLDGVEGDAEDCRGFFGIEAFDIAEDEHGAVLLGEFFHAGADELMQL